MPKIPVTEKIIITANVKRRKANSLRRGLILPDDERLILGRRRANAKINFYDLGQINTGTTETPVWSDLPALYSPSYTVSITLGASYNVQLRVEKFPDAQFDAYTDLLFEVPVAEWRTTYRKIKKSLAVGFFNVRIDDVFGAMTTLSDDEPVGTEAEQMAAHGFAWSETGLKYRGLDSIDHGSPVWYSFDTEDTTNYKITATRDVEADAVSFTVSGEMDVYLVPKVALSLGFADYDAFPVTFLDIVYRGGGYQYFPGTELNPTGTLEADYATYLAYLLTRDGVRAHEAPGAVGSGTSISPASFDTGAAKAFYGMYGHGINLRLIDGGYGVNLSSDVIGDNFLFTNYVPFLVAVIRKGSRYYYVWDVSGDEGTETPSISSIESAGVEGYDVRKNSSSGPPL